MSDQATVRPAGRGEWTPLLPVPLGMRDKGVPGRHVKRGEPEKLFAYYDEAHQLLGYIGRFKRKEHAGHEMITLTFCQHGASGDRGWRWISFPDPRPLYGLDRQTDGPVLLCTDELQADYAHQQVGFAFWCLSWPGGAKLFKKVDWQPIAGREIYILPDGTTTPAALAKHLTELLPDAAIVVAAPKQEIPLGLAAADAMVDLGWDMNDLATFALMPPPPPEQAPPPPVARKKKVPPGTDDWRIGLLYADSGKLIDCRENVIMILQRHPAWQGVLGLDEFTNRVMIREAPEDVDGFEPGEWEPQHDVHLGLWLSQQDDRMLKVIIKSETTIGAAVNYVAGQNRFNPVRDYLDELEWDETHRLEDWLSDCLGVKKNEYSGLVGRYFLLGMVARIYEPGCQMRLVPVLEGDQWRGKSTALRTLGGEWFSDTPFNVGDKDAYQALQGKWLYEIAEFDSFSRAEASRVKAFVSSVNDNYRAPYERRNRDWPRQCVFAATVNHDEYFKDTSGNTRFAPVRTGEILIDTLAGQRDQLFAEAVARYHAGERQYPTREELEQYFKPEQDLREIADPWVDMIVRWLRTDAGSSCTVENVLFECLKVERSKIDNARSMATRIGVALKRAGWERKRRADGARDYYYVRPKDWAMPGETPAPQQDADGKPPF